MNRFEQRDSSAKVILIIVGSIVGVLLLVLLVCGGVTFFLVRKAGQEMMPQLQAQMDRQLADSAVLMFLNDLGAGQIEAAYNGTTAAFRARQTLPQFQKFVTQNPMLTKFDRMDPQQAAPLNNPPGANRMSLPYTLTGNGIMNLTFQVVKEGEQWKIDAVTVP